MTTITSLSSTVANAHQRIDGKVDKDGGDIGGSFRFGGMSDPSSPAAGDAAFYSSTAGTLRWKNSFGQVGNVPMTSGNVQTFSATTTGFSDLTASWPIEANEPNIGTAYRVKTWGKGVQGSTAQLLGTQVACYGNNATSGFAATKIPANAAFYWSAEATVIVVTTGGSGSILVKSTWDVSVPGRSFEAGATFAPFSFVGISSVAVSADTTASTTMSVTAAWGSTTGSPTISGMASTFERLGA